MSDPLFPHHRKLLHDRGVSDGVIAARGYSSTAKAEWLTGEGFGQAVGKLGSGLVIPVFGAAGYQRFYQFRPDSPRMRDGKPAKYELPFRQRLAVDVPPGIARELASPRRPLWVTESPIKGDSAVSAGLVCVGTFGAMGWRGRNQFGGKSLLADWRAIAWEGREVFIADDSDMATNADVKRAASELGAIFDRWGADVRWVFIPPLHDGGKQGLDDWLARNGRDIHALLTYADDRPPDRLATSPQGGSHIPGKVPPRAAPDVPAQTIAQVEATFARWLHDGDGVTTRAVLAVYVANMALDGDPVWMILVGGSGQGKTERLVPLSGMPDVVMASTLSSEAALLSGTPDRDRAADANGGMLRVVGDRGVLIIKDFASVLEMDRTARGQVLAALRDVYDGRWDRPVGADGGRTLTWEGKCGLLAACTTAIDKAHSVMNDMGPRSLFLRLEPVPPAQAGRAALAHMGRETAMRAELAAAAAGLLTHLPGTPHPVSEPVTAGLVGLASLVSQARSPVHRDWNGEIELVGDPEAPTRLIKQIGQIWRACGVLGLDPAQSWEVVRRCALDSVPKLRGKVIRWLADHPGEHSTTSVGEGVVHPTRTVRRALEDLTAHGVTDRKPQGQGHPDLWQLSARARSWLTAGDTLPEMWDPPQCTVCGLPMNAALAATGFTTHPNCDPEGTT